MQRKSSISLQSTTGRVTSLEQQEYFHGVLPREEINILLRNNGDFLVRESPKSAETCIVLSVMWGHPRHCIVQTDPDGTFLFEGPSFRTVTELVEYYWKRRLPVTEKSGAILKTPIKQQKWQLRNDDILIEKPLGKGNFGDVFQARLKSHGNMEVAVKTCQNLAMEEKRKFLFEARIMRNYLHPNIVRIIGVCAQRDPIMIVIELMPGGSLSTYLRKNKENIGVKQKHKFCLDAAKGMCYLEAQKCIHRDLAARNCLLGKNNELKIADFGLSREASEYRIEGAKQIPIKWTAPEALNYGSYTSKSDVWSYSILMWEIFSEGQLPYVGMTNREAASAIDKGYRMSPPPDMPPGIAEVMASCWRQEPNLRPSFKEIKQMLEAQTPK